MRRRRSEGRGRRVWPAVEGRRQADKLTKLACRPGDEWWWWWWCRRRNAGRTQLTTQGQGRRRWATAGARADGARPRRPAIEDWQGQGKPTPGRAGDVWWVLGRRRRTGRTTTRQRNKWWWRLMSGNVSPGSFEIRKASKRRKTTHATSRRHPAAGTPPRHARFQADGTPFNEAEEGGRKKALECCETSIGEQVRSKPR